VDARVRRRSRHIGLFALVGTPYTLKFLWAPLVDALTCRSSRALLGRRRGWLVFSQMLLIGAILLLALTIPRARRVSWRSARCWSRRCRRPRTSCRCFPRREPAESEQAAGMASYVAAYRIGMLVSTAARCSWSAASKARAYARRGVDVGLCGDGGAGADRHGHGACRHRAGAIARARSRTQARERVHAACCMPPWARFGILSASALRRARLRRAVQVHRLRFRRHDRAVRDRPRLYRNDYAAIVKGVGLAATLIGGFAGGFVARRYRWRSLWIGGVVQAFANLSFSWLRWSGHINGRWHSPITAENFTSAIGTVIFVAYLSALCQNPLHTATQYALLTALAAVGRTYLSTGAGYVAKATGWPLFFVICVLVAIPSLIPAGLAAAARAF
jgi:PAT family beta-lactamase induction signal transducer AmpG